MDGYLQGIVKSRMGPLRGRTADKGAIKRRKSGAVWKRDKWRKNGQKRGGERRFSPVYHKLAGFPIFISTKNATFLNAALIP
jgi:hypothetical protein